jgi:ParB family chromosome partitioning protein
VTTVHSLPVADIRPHPHNPRQALGDLTELADSIRSQGVLQPITVVPDPDNAIGYVCLLGHRRHAASELAGQNLIPAIVRTDLSASAQLVAMGVENIQRSDLTPVEEATWLQGLLDLGEVKRSQLSKVTGMSKTTVSSRLKLAHLPDAAKAKVHEGQATLEDALQLADADLPADVVEDLTGKLGTPAFRWEMEQAQRAAKAAKDRAKVRERLEGVGVVWSEDAAIEVTRWAFDRRVDVDVTAEDLAALPAGCMAVPGHWGSEVNIYRPLTDDEAVKVATELEERYQANRARQAAPSWEERQEAIRALVEPLNVARALRVEFLTQFMTGAKLLTPGQSTAVFDELVFGIGALGWDVDDQFGWVDLGRSTPLSLPEKHALVLAPEGRDRLALAALAASVESAPEEEHGDIFGAVGVFSAYKTANGWGPYESIRRWYSLLEHLGYVPSEWEVERLALGLPEVDDVEDGAEDEAVAS